MNFINAINLPRKSGERSGEICGFADCAGPKLTPSLPMTVGETERGTGSELKDQRRLAQAGARQRIADPYSAL